MKDGKINKYAIIVNLDTQEERHINNVDRAGATLKEDGYKVALLSPRNTYTAGELDFYADATPANLEKILAQLKLDEDDQVVIYTTGHGSKKGLANLGSTFSIEKLQSAINKKFTGKLTMVMDQCYSGKAKDLQRRPNTLFIAPDWQEVTTSCGYFAPYFWAKDSEIIASGGDANHDQHASLEERFDYAAAVYMENIPGSIPVYKAGKTYSDQGFDDASNPHALESSSLASFSQITGDDHAVLAWAREQTAKGNLNGLVTQIDVYARKPKLFQKNPLDELIKLLPFNPSDVAKYVAATSSRQIQLFTRKHVEALLHLLPGMNKDLASTLKELAQKRSELFQETDVDFLVQEMRLGNWNAEFILKKLTDAKPKLFSREHVQALLQDQHSKEKQWARAGVNVLRSTIPPFGTDTALTPPEFIGDYMSEISNTVLESLIEKRPDLFKREDLVEKLQNAQQGDKEAVAFVQQVSYDAIQLFREEDIPTIAKLDSPSNSLTLNNFIELKPTWFQRAEIEPLIAQWLEVSTYSSDNVLPRNTDGRLSNLIKGNPQLFQRSDLEKIIAALAQTPTRPALTLISFVWHHNDLFAKEDIALLRKIKDTPHADFWITTAFEQLEKKRPELF